MHTGRQVFVVKLSGSIFGSPRICDIIKTVRDALEEQKQLFLILVAGGGATARKYIQAGLELGLDQATLDELGILSSQLNATLLAESLYPVASRIIPKSLSKIAEQLEVLLHRSGPKIVIIGGLHPGQSTNAVGALVAEKTRADLFINATDVEGVYDRDPGRFKEAILLENVTPDRLSNILGSESVQAGTYDLMDPVALKLISRSRIPTKIVKCDSSVLSKVFQGAKVGTTIVFET